MTQPYKNVQEFAKDVFERVVMNHSYFIKQSLDNGYISLSDDGYEVSYPNQMRISDTTDFFLVELLGNSLWENSLYFKKKDFDKVESFPSLAMYLVPGPLLSVEPTTAALNLTKGQPVDVTRINFVTTSFLGIEKSKFSHDMGDGKNSTTIITDSPNALIIIRGKSPFVCLQDVTFYSVDAPRVYFRFFSLLLATHKSTPKNIFLDHLRKSIRSKESSGGAFGVIATPDSGKMHFIAELESFADQDVAESILDKFLQDHAEKFRKSLFGYDKVLSQIELKWIEKPYPEVIISKPDYIMVKEDGTIDIVDVKKSLNRAKPMIKGQPARRRFIDYVQELIAQLRTYEEYFSYPKNADWAAKNLGIKYDPKTIRLVGIVGNHDNLSDTETKKILQSNNAKIHLINYNTLAAMAKAKI